MRILAAIFMLALVSPVWAKNKPAKDCQLSLTSADLREAAKARLKNVKDLVRDGLDTHAYIARWKVHLNDPRDQMPRQGETLVVGLTSAQSEAWMEKIGRRSIGLILNGLPEERLGTAFLRIGDKFYSEDRIREGREPRSFLSVIKKATRSLGYTEVTLLVTPQEMKAVQDFINARGKDRITAVCDIPRVAKAGDVIHPEWTHTGDNLKFESCAAAVLSWVNEDWLQHYSDPKPLRALREKFNLRWTHVANRIVWENFRNPKASMITLHRIERSKKPLESGLQKHLSWGKVRGLYPFAFVADVPETSSDKFESERLSLAEWLGE